MIGRTVLGMFVSLPPPRAATLRSDRIAACECTRSETGYGVDVHVPGLGLIVEDADLGWYRSAPVSVAVLGAAECRFALKGYADDPAPDDFHTAIRTFLALDRSALDAAESSIFAYYRDVMDQVVADEDDEWYVAVYGRTVSSSMSAWEANPGSAGIPVVTSMSTSRSNASATGNQNTVCRSCSVTAPQ